LREYVNLAVQLLNEIRNELAGWQHSDIRKINFVGFVTLRAPQAIGVSTGAVLYRGGDCNVQQVEAALRLLEQFCESICESVDISVQGR
jgi:hypothetical protein